MTRLVAGAVMVTGLLVSTGVSAQDVSGIEQVNGTGIYCRRVGKGEPVVIVHGGPGMAHDYLFKPFAPLASSYQLFFYDQRGNGRSDAFKPGEKISVDDLVEDLEALRNRWGLEQFNLAGQSWGAIIAVKYTAKYPKRVKRLLLLEPAPGSSEALPEFVKRIRERLSAEDKEELVALDGNPATRSDPALYKRVANLQFKAYYFDRTKQDLDKMDYMDADHVKKWAQSSAMFNPYLASFNLYDTMKTITCPVLIIAGRHDPIPTESIERMATSMPQAQLHIIEECGHFAHIEKPAEYFGLIRRFLAQ